MKKFFGLALIASLMISAALAQSVRPTQKPATATATTAVVAPAAASGTTAVDELIGLLPASDLIAVIDVNRAFNELLPRLANIEVGGVNKFAAEIADFSKKTGIDPSKISSAVLGFTMDGAQGTGAIIVSGLDLNPAQIEAVMKEFKAEFKASEYKGKTLFNVISKVKAPEAGPLSVKTDETALAPLGGQRFVFGDLKAVKSVIDINSGEAKGGVSPAVSSGLKETRSSALLRFALNVPENLKHEAADQGDLFKSVATIKLVLGTFDVANDFSLALDALMRTASPKEATELEEGLKGLVSLVQGIFGGSDPKTEAIGQVLNQIKVGSKVNDVSLSIALPRAVLDQLTKRPATAPAPAEKKP